MMYENGRFVRAVDCIIINATRINRLIKVRSKFLRMYTHALERVSEIAQLHRVTSALNNDCPQNKLFSCTLIQYARSKNTLLFGSKFSTTKFFS